MSGTDDVKETTEYAAAWDIDGKTLYQHAVDDQDAHRRVARMMGHHRRGGVQASNYRVVQRVVRAGPWK